MAGTRVPLYRGENNGLMSAGENNSVFHLTYSMSFADNFHPGANDGTIQSRYPICIYRYKVTIVGDFYGAVYQTYGDSDDILSLTVMDFSNDEFCQGLKQYDLFPGTSTTMGKTTIRYSAKKNPKSLQKKFGKWRRPPIYLGPSSGNFFNISVKNFSDSDARTYQAIVSIPSWRQFL